MVHIVERRILLAVSVAALFIIISSFPFVFLDAYAMKCDETSDYSFQMILDCTDTIDVKKSTMDYVYSDINRFSKSFQDSKLYNISTQGSNTFATLEIPLAYGFSLKSDVQFSKSPYYLLEFLNGKLAGSKLYISLSERDGYDGTKDAGSLVNFKFQVKNVPCYWGICGSASNFEYALDRGLYLLEPLAKKIQLELEQSQNSQKQTTQTKEADLRGPPIVDYDNDGIADSKDLCKFDKETYNGFLDDDGCPDKVPQKVITLTTPKTIQAPKELPSTFSIFRVERGEYTISKYSTTEVLIMGKIEGPGRGESIILSIRSPDGSVEKINSLVAGSGNFGNVIVLDGKSPLGLYSVVARNENKLSEPISFQVKRSEDVAKESTPPVIITQKLPNWIKNNAGWWVDGHIDNRDFAKGIESMIKLGVIQVHEIKTTVKPNLLIDDIPGWVKTNAKWWVDGHITDKEFRQTIEFLIKEGVIRT